MKKFLLVCAAVLTAFSGNALAGNKWNGIGEIKSLSIYPTYAVIEQGDAGGVEGCSEYNLYSFNWSDFNDNTQERILSVLLHAYAIKAPIQVLVSDNTCGPEGHKKFLGHITYK